MLEKAILEFEESSCKLASIIRRTPVQLNEGWNELIVFTKSDINFLVSIEFVSKGVGNPDYWSVKVTNVKDGLSIIYSSFMSQIVFSSSVIVSRLAPIYSEVLENANEHFLKEIKHVKRSLF